MSKKKIPQGGQRDKSRIPKSTRENSLKKIKKRRLSREEIVRNAEEVETHIGNKQRVKPRVGYGI